MTTSAIFGIIPVSCGGSPVHKRPTVIPAQAGIHVRSLDCTPESESYRELYALEYRGRPEEDELHNYMDTVHDLVDPRSAWSRGELPRAVVACESTPTAGGFYMDSAGGPQWETLVASEFPEVMAQRFDIGGSSRAECACRTG